MSMSASAVLDREFFELRAKILELGASLDRMGRGDGSVAGDPRMALLHKGIEILKSEETDRAERIQLLFSLEYNDQWRQDFQIASGPKTS